MPSLSILDLRDSPDKTERQPRARLNSPRLIFHTQGLSQIIIAQGLFSCPLWRLCAILNNMADKIVAFFSGIFGSELTVFLVAMLPVVELRGAIPVGVAAGLPLWEAALLGVAGSILPAPIILLALIPVLGLLKSRPTPVSRRKPSGCNIRSGKVSGAG